MSKKIEPESEEKNEILNVVKEIFRSFDAQEWRKLRSLFIDEVAFDVVSSSGDISAKYFTDDLINIWKEKLNSVRKSYHHLSDQTIELNQEIASVSTKTYTFHRLEDSVEEGFWEMWTDYTHYLVKTPDGWKCNVIKMVVPSKSEDHDVTEFFPKT